jgi:HPt (histidine-containing phosphotransfer) domain-containing protein
MGDQEDIQVDFTALRTLAGDDDTFVMALLMKMCNALPLAFQNMEQFAAASEWSALKSAAHKAKSTFAYLSLEDMRNRLKEIENDAMDGVGLDLLPAKVAAAVQLGRRVLVVLQAELARVSG